MTWAPPPLYAILDCDLLAARRLAPDDVLEVWLAAGVTLVQLRAKSLALGPMLDLADRLGTLAARAGATFIVNDRVDVAKLSGAAGAHVGQDDLTPSQARTVLGPGALVGLSTHTADQVREGLREPVSYLAIGPVFPTSTKARPDAVVGLEGVRAAAGLCHGEVPLVAIGGITAERAPAVLAAGATSVAVAGGLLAGDWKKTPGSFLTNL